MTMQIATSVIDSLKAQPLALALVVMNVALLGFLFYLEVNHDTQMQETMKLVFGQQEKVNTLLAQCVAYPK